MRRISPFEPEPYEGDDTSPSVSNSSLYIRKWAIDWLSSGSVPPMSVLIKMRGFTSGFTRDRAGQHTATDSAANRMDINRCFIVQVFRFVSRLFPSVCKYTKRRVQRQAKNEVFWPARNIVTVGCFLN